MQGRMQAMQGRMQAMQGRMQAMQAMPVVMDRGMRMGVPPAPTFGMPARAPMFPGSFPSPFLSMRPDAPIEITCVPQGGMDPTIMLCRGDATSAIPPAATYWDGKHHVRCDGTSNACRIVYPSLEPRSLASQQAPMRAGGSGKTLPATSAGAFCVFEGKM